MEKLVNIQLKQIQDVKDFVNIITKIDGDFVLESGRYIVDAKSIMGIFSLDLSQKILLRIQRIRRILKKSSVLQHRRITPEIAL